MKKLIFTLLLVPFTTLAQNRSATNEMGLSDAAIKNKMMTVVKDVEVEKALAGSAEFAKCRDDYKFEAADDEAKRTKKIQDAITCFKGKISGKNSDELKKFAEAMNLESYGLIKSKNVSDITEYLSKKITKSLTGRDPDDKSIENMKWEKQKIVDQKVFVELYTNQLMKSALFEVSRYCFENLRNKTGPVTDFATHWAGFDLTKDPVVSELSDVSSQPFGNISATDMTKKEDVYKNITDSLGSQIDAKTYGAYFTFCQKALPAMCKGFREEVKKSGKSDKTALNNDLADVKKITTNAMSDGANACLTMDRLTSIRSAMQNTEKVAKQFDDMGEDKDKFALQMISKPQIYARGKGTSEESLDELSSISSSDMLAGAQNDDLSDLEAKCSQPGGPSECDDFLLKGDGVDKAIHNVEYQMTLKREIETERVKQMKDKEELKKYLEENGYFEILNDPNLTPQTAADKIGEIFDARKIAEVEALKLKVGKRQVSEKDYSDLGDQGRADLMKQNIGDAKQERARLAQVVMFNNIITSQLELEEKGSKKIVGRNVNAWRKELAGLEKDGINTELFNDIKDSTKDSGNLDDASVVGGGIIDMILGKKEDKNP